MQATVRSPLGDLIIPQLISEPKLVDDPIPSVQYAWNDDKPFVFSDTVGRLPELRIRYIVGLCSLNTDEAQPHWDLVAAHKAIIRAATKLEISDGNSSFKRVYDLTPEHGWIKELAKKKKLGDKEPQYREVEAGFVGDGSPYLVTAVIYKLSNGKVFKTTSGKVIVFH